MAKNANQTAFPMYGNNLITEYGLSKREYFAAIALQGLLSCPDIVLKAGDTLAACALREADELLIELSKPV